MNFLGNNKMQWSIDNNFLIGSSNPNFSDIKKLFSFGFKSIISFLSHNETPNYNNKDAEKLGFIIYSIPIEDFSAPTISDFMLFIDKLHNSFERGKVLIHCQGGKGRTGTFAAAYWINKGLSAEEAIKKVRNNQPEAIETPEQEDILFELEIRLKEDE
jgi:protein-tyrosine phosphatase